MLNELPPDMDGGATTPAENRFFSVNREAQKNKREECRNVSPQFVSLQTSSPWYLDSHGVADNKSKEAEDDL